MCRLSAPDRGRGQRRTTVAKGAYIHVLTGCSYRDLEILCLTTYLGNAEFTKRRLCTEDSWFHTVRARSPKNLWRVLYRCAYVVTNLTSRGSISTPSSRGFEGPSRTSTQAT